MYPLSHYHIGLRSSFFVTLNYTIYPIEERGSISRDPTQLGIFDMVYYFTSAVVDPPAYVYVGKDKFESEAPAV